MISKVLGGKVDIKRRKNRRNEQKKSEFRKNEKKHLTIEFERDIILRYEKTGCGSAW